MREFHLSEIDTMIPSPGPPDFNQLKKVLSKQEPDRPTLFEFFLNSRLHQKLSGKLIRINIDWVELQVIRLIAFQRAGYDFLTVEVPGFDFIRGEISQKASISQNQGSVIHSQKDFDQYIWPKINDVRWDLLEKLSTYLPRNMKLILHSSEGVLECAISLVGYENLCMLIMDDPVLASDIFSEIGSRLYLYYKQASRFDFVGALISNDDWGFKTQTLFSPKAMRKFVFPWHKKIVETIHAASKFAILHSCGYYADVIEDVIDVMKYDARHSYEDNIQPIESAYEEFHNRIALLGGMDLDFVCRAEPKEVYERSKGMLNRSLGRGAYALGTGNSVPDYVPDDHYFAMIKAALHMR